ncbi:hypothetical protein ACLOJK_012632 [Asimina triloba]
MENKAKKQKTLAWWEEGSAKESLRTRTEGRDAAKRAVFGGKHAGRDDDEEDDEDDEKVARWESRIGGSVCEPLIWTLSDQGR